VGIQKKLVLFAMMPFLGREAVAQTTDGTNGTAAAAETIIDTETILDPSPFSSCRASGMGGALSTVADDLDALYYNPAGIGGLGFKPQKDKLPAVRGIIFPYASGSINENARSTQRKFKANGAQSDASAGAAILDANTGKRQYARASFIPMGFLVGRTAAVPIIDHQIAAASVAGSPGQVKMRYRTISGVMLGSSIADNGNRFSLGVSRLVGTLEETAGTFAYVDMVDVDKRKEILKANRKTYNSNSTNVGMMMRIPKSVTPTLSIVARNVGNSENPAKDPSQKPLVYQEDLTAGFSISPDIGKIGRFNLVLESGFLTQKHMAGKKKMRGGLELLLGGDTGKSLFGLRFGGNNAGGSAGMHLNIGLIGVEAEVHAIDVGIDNDRVIERRASGTFYINVASF
jgi:hypothetical protein